LTKKGSSNDFKKFKNCGENWENGLKWTKITTKKVFFKRSRAKQGKKGERNLLESL